MQISEEKIKKYQEVFLKEYGFEIDYAQASQELSSLVCLVGAVYRHQTKKHESN
jgi:hypothetical protein